MTTESMPLGMRREVRTTDREQVRQLAESTGFFRPDEVEVAVELVDDFLKDGVASGYHFLFAERDDHCVGYVCYGPIGCTLGSFDIYWIIVDPNFQGMGIGRQLLRQVEADLCLLNARHIYIETSNKPQYEPTRQFYLRCGYSVAATIADFYEDGDDKVVLVRDVRQGK